MSDLSSSGPVTLSADDFAPLPHRDDIHGINRPSRSYWQDAWRRLKSNRRALFSLC